MFRTRWIVAPLVLALAASGAVRSDDPTPKKGADDRQLQEDKPYGDQRILIKEPSGFLAEGERRLYSGPQAGEPLPPLRATVIAGQRRGEELDVVALADGAPQVVVLMDEGIVGLKGLLGLTNWTPIVARNAGSGLHVSAVFLGDDPDAVVRAVRDSGVSLEGRLDVLAVSPDGRNGPGIYGLDRKVSQTVIIAKDGVVLHNFAFPQGMSYFTDPHVLGALAEAVGEAPATVSAWLGEEAPKGTMMAASKGKGGPLAAGQRALKQRLGELIKAGTLTLEDATALYSSAFPKARRKRDTARKGADKKTSTYADPAGGFPSTAYEYARMVEPELGVPPRIDLGDAVEIPLFVDGARAYGNLGRSCDNPSLLGKDTVSGSTLQRHEGRTADGQSLPHVVWVSFGRNSSHSPEEVVGSVQMIGYNRETGATAFFESSDRIAPWVTLDEGTLRMRGALPWIDEPEEFNRAFVPPGGIQCVGCHQSDPFITNSFINAARLPGSDEGVVPVLGRDSPYDVIGGEDWDMRTIHIEGNSCFDCHRVGTSTMQLFMTNGWDPNDHMPPHDPGSLAEDLRELLDAWQRGPEDVPGADWIIPPARGEGRRVVGDDYPYKAHFNEPGEGFLN